MSEARDRLRARQGALVRALVAAQPLPPGFDAAWAGTTAGSLLRKRRRGVARAWPRLVRSLGRDYAPLFTEYAAAVPPASEGYYATDGARFAAWLEGSGRLSDEGRIELALWRIDSRRLDIALVRVSSPRGILLAGRIGPWRVARLLRLPRSQRLEELWEGLAGRLRGRGVQGT